MPGDDDFKDSSREQWGGSAEHWAKAVEEPDFGASAAAAEWMLEAADLQPGERVLELACGAGRVGLQAAQQVGDDGLVVCSDFAEPMVGAVRERAARLGLANVEARVLDAENLALADDERFDVVLCRFGYMLMGDPGRALAESARALEPGGRLVLAVWGPPGDNPWLMTILETVMEHLNAPPPEPGAPGPFVLGDRDRLRGLIEDAGLDDVDVTALKVEQSYDSPDAWWERISSVGGPLRAILASMDESDVDAIKQNAFERAADYVRDDGTAVFPAVVIAARARRPAQPA